MSDTTAVRAPLDGDATPLDLRLVISPSVGTFDPAPVDVATTEGEIVRSGDVIGTVAAPGRTDHVTAFCGGFLVRWMAEPGERVRAGQPLAQLHPFDPSPAA